jgi:lysophospholipase L1-like esterase
MASRSADDASGVADSSLEAAADGNQNMVGFDAGADDATEVDASAGPDAEADAADGASPYNPCPPSGTPCSIMPLGDSITFGFQSSTVGGYRVPMFDSAVKAGHAITFVGSQTSGPATVDGMPFARQNEGHSGYTIDDGGGRSGLQNLVQNAIQTYHPHIVTLMIGTNDVDIQLDLANAPARLAKLLDTILAADPNLLLVVAQITPTQDDAENTRIQAYNAAIPSLVAARAQKGMHILGVDMYGALVANPSYKTAYFADNLHLNDAGFVIMYGVWYSAIGGLFR